MNGEGETARFSKSETIHPAKFVQGNPAKFWEVHILLHVLLWPCLPAEFDKTIDFTGYFEGGVVDGTRTRNNKLHKLGLYH